jgi:hypothetical protein
VKPVIADAHGVSELGGIEGAYGVPVAEGSEGAELFCSPVEVGGFAVEPINEREGVDAVASSMGDGGEAEPRRTEFGGWLGEEAVRFLEVFEVQTVRERDLADDGTEVLEVVVAEEDARVILLK